MTPGGGFPKVGSAPAPARIGAVAFTAAVVIADSRMLEVAVRLAVSAPDCDAASCSSTASSGAQPARCRHRAPKTNDKTKHLNEELFTRISLLRCHPLQRRVC